MQMTPLITHSQCDQLAWQQAFFSSLDQQCGKREIGKEERSSPNDRNEELGCPVWANDRFDISLFQKSLSAHHKTKVIAVAKRVFEERLPELKETKDLFIGFTGSDGREEKLNPHASPVEIVVGIRSTESLKSGAIDKIRTLISQHPDLFYKDIEVKCLETDALITFKGEKDERPFPTRALDARYLVGNEDTFIAYRKAFFKELQEPKNSKALARFKKNAVQDTYRVFKRTFEGVDKSQIDLSTGKVSYDGNRIKGVKYPYLRPIQYKLAMYVFSLIQNNKISEADFFQMPSPTIERIQWLAEKKLIKATPEEINSFQKAYIASLVWFSISQKRFEVFKNSEISLPTRELKGVADAIAQFCNRLAA